MPKLPTFDLWSAVCWLEPNQESVNFEHLKIRSRLHGRYLLSKFLDIYFVLPVELTHNSDILLAVSPCLRSLHMKPYQESRRKSLVQYGDRRACLRRIALNPEKLMVKGFFGFPCLFQGRILSKVPISARVDIKGLLVR